MSSIQDVLQRRGIKGLTHFTRLENLDSILMHGIVPRSYLVNSATPINGILTDSLRLDGKDEYSCFSISFPNSQMFYHYRMKERSSKWVVIGLSAQVLVDKTESCLFYPQNAASKVMTDLEVDKFKGAKALEAMFSPFANTSKDPVDVQAEVMISDVIEPKYIGLVIFNDRNKMDEYQRNYPELKKRFSYHSEGQGFFAQRQYARNHGFTWI